MIDSEAPVSSMALPGLARALVAAGTLSQQSAEGLYAKAQAHKSSFIAELVGSGSLSARDLAHTMSRTFAAPLIDLDAIDAQRLPKGVLDPKVAQQLRIVVLSRRGKRITVATADPTHADVAEKIKFTTQLTVDWVIAELDKLIKLTDSASASASEAIEHIVGGEFEFDTEAIELAAAES